MGKEWHVWDFPDNIRIYFSDGFREWLFAELKNICETRAELSRRLGLHTSMVKSYLQTGHDSKGLKTYIPVKVIKKIIESFNSQLGITFSEKLESSIIAYRARAGWPVYKPKLPIKETPSVYSILFHIICDGSASKGKTPYYANTCKELRQAFIKNLQIFGGVETNEYLMHSNVFGVMFPKAITDILSHIFSVPLSGPRKFPKQVLEALKDCQLEAIKVMFDDEGFVSKKGQTGFTTTDFELVEGMKHLLLQNSFKPSKIYVKRRGTKKDYAICILTESWKAFLTAVGFDHPRKRRRLRDAIKNREYRLKYKPLKERIYELLFSYSPLDRLEIAKRLNAKIPATKVNLYELRRERRVFSKFNGKNNFYLWYSR